MTTPTLSLTEDQAMTALRSFLLAVVPAGVEVVRGLDNRVPEPAGTDFVTMTPILRERLATNTTAYSDGFPVNGPQIRIDRAPMRLTVQVDVHGPASADNAQVIATLFRSDWASDQFASSGFDVTPLFAGEPRQLPFSNAEQQIEERWSIDIVMQANPLTTVPQDFADHLSVGIVSVDVTYPT